MANISDNHGISLESQMKDFTEWNPNPIVVLSAKGEVVYLNLVARAQFPTFTHLGKNHPLLAGLIEQVADFKKIRGEFVVFFREAIFLNCMYEQQIFSVGDKALIFIYMNDITARKYIEDQLNKQNAKLTEAMSFLNNIFESSIEYSIVATDLEGTILTWNAGAKRNYGYEAEEMIGQKNICLLNTPEDLNSGAVQTFLAAVLKEGKAERIFERVRKNHDNFTASIVMTLRRDAEGNPIGYLLISRDITAQKHLEEQLKINQELAEQNKLAEEKIHLKNEFLANMSHELRTPLNAVIGFSELVYEEKLGSLNAEQKDALNDVLVGAKHLLQIIVDLLDITNIELSKMQFNSEQIDLKKYLEEITHYFDFIIQEKHINLTVTIDESISTVYLDASRFKQVLYNYLSNAFKFSPQQGIVHLRILSETTAMFRLEVEDNGTGLSPEEAKNLFIAFQQLDASMTKKHSGIGLGLSLTKHIVEAQGGKVGAVCTPGKGNIFYAILPRHY